MINCTHLSGNDFDFKLNKSKDITILYEKLKEAMSKGEAKSIHVSVDNQDRTFGTILGSMLTRKFGQGLAHDTYHIKCNGYGGQSFGAFIPKGLTLELEGDSNDYMGKGLSGGKIIVYPNKKSTFKHVKEFILDKNGNVKQVVLVNLEFAKEEETGKTVMKEVAKSEKTVQADLILIAAGFLGNDETVAKMFGVESDERNNVATNVSRYKTSRNKVFVAGDMHRGQSLVVWAIREGREAAREVDKYLMGYSNL